MNQNLKEYVNRYVNFSDSELIILDSFLVEKSVKKKEFLLREGDICKTRFFILKGCLRLFYIDQKANERIIHFGIDNWWITDYESLINQVPTKLFIQSTEDTSLLMLSNSDFEKLCIALPKAERLFRKIMEKTYIASQRRIEYIYSLNGEDMFNTFIEANLEFTQRVPQYMIASYLGMSPEFISKIKAKKK